jgi:ribA/ribD-fused uncharacterized protein
MTTEEKRVIIDRFVGEFRFLSNFYPSIIRFGGCSWSSVEHAYQALKSDDPVTQRMIRTASTPGEAKRLGKLIVVRPDWDEVRVDVMRRLVWLKFENPFVRPLLLATDNAELVECNTWGDVFWGTCGGVGQNVLGKILMETRDKVRIEEAAEITHQ